MKRDPGMPEHEEKITLHSDALYHRPDAIPTNAPGGGTPHFNRSFTYMLFFWPTTYLHWLWPLRYFRLRGVLFFLYLFSDDAFPLRCDGIATYTGWRCFRRNNPSCSAIWLSRCMSPRCHASCMASHNPQHSLFIVSPHSARRVVPRMKCFMHGTRCFPHGYPHAARLPKGPIGTASRMSYFHFECRCITTHPATCMEWYGRAKPGGGSAPALPTSLT